MKPSEVEVVGKNVPGGTNADRLSEYRGELIRPREAEEALEELRESERQLVSDLERLEGERGEVLEAGTDPDGLAHITARIEITSNKIKKRAGEIAATEALLSSQTANVEVRFEALQRLYVHWLVEREVGRLREGLGAPCHQNLLETVARCTKPVVEIRNLSMTAPAEREMLLSRVAADPGFDVPPYVVPVPTAAPVDPGEPPCAPRGDLGVDVDAEFSQYLREDPTMTRPRALKRLYKEHPEIFVPLPSDFEFQQQTAWPAGMIGSTTVPEESAKQQFSHAR